MAYVTDTHIEDRLGSAAYVQLTDDDGNGVADAAVVQEARLGAEGEVNSYLARRYQVPIDLTVHSELTDVLRSFTLDLVELRLRARRPPVPAETLRRRADAIEWLSRIAKGTIELPSVALVSAGSGRGSLGTTTGATRVLSRDELADH